MADSGPVRRGRTQAAAAEPPEYGAESADAVGKDIAGADVPEGDKGLVEFVTDSVEDAEYHDQKAQAPGLQVVFQKRVEGWRAAAARRP